MKARRQRGSVSAMYGIVLPVIVALMGMTLDLSLAFQRRAQLQQVVDVAAVTAAQQLNDAVGGITAARTLAGVAVAMRQVRGTQVVALPDAAYSFAAAPEGPWVSYASALAQPSGLRYVRVDAAALGADYTSMPVLFGSFLNASGPTTLDASATAGPNALRVLPLAICAASSVPVAVRSNGGGVDELVYYGFRHGVNYNLLALNPAAGASTGEYFLVDPASPPGSTPLPASTDDANVAPFMCTGKLAYTAMVGEWLHLRRGGAFGLWQQLNSRFGDNSSTFACDNYSAPPDTNVRDYFGANASWMNSAPPQASAASSTPAAGKPLLTIADAPPPLPAVAAAQYGTLWAYGPAKSSPSAGAIAAGKWNILYPATPALAAPGWPSTGPYGTNAYMTAPAGGVAGRKGRRLLHVPLLACPIPAGAYVDGQVLAVARFLLTAHASATAVPGEFAGILSASDVAKLSSDVELLR
ncbi:TadE/TadG family type IV pilus assembly protein [Pseudoduganella sp. OTU4001]|uniref:TadE/TadG family type IV pilus assembly protein n=1 Tax=Pseudoduganella sp. OTU4001 TaxID=3043854 RepID=UPI00313DF73B